MTAASHIRKPYTGTNRALIVALDVGTTFSGVSYAILEPGEVPKIHGVTRFPGQEHVAGNSKIPSIIYYDSNGQVKAAGAEAESARVISQAEDEAWSKVELFKLRLRPKAMKMDMNGMKLSHLPRGKSSGDVFGDFLRYLFKCTSQFIKDTHANGIVLWRAVERDIQFVLSHPNGWEGAQQSKMRRAAISAGLIPDSDEGKSRIRFVTEGEASLHACVLNGLTADVLATRQADNGFIVADAGGGTLDISTYAIRGTSPLTIEEIAPADCVFAGSVFVSRRARVFLEKKLKSSKYDTPDALDHITKRFDETTKRLFRDKSEPQYIPFGSPLDKDLEVGIRGGQLKLTGAEVAELFEPSIEAAVNAIKSQIRASAGVVKAVWLVGGFAANPWLFTQLQERLAPLNVTVNRPDTQTSKAVADGAIGFFCDHHVSARMSKFMYGVEYLRECNMDDQEHATRASRLLTLPSGPKLLPDAFDCILAKNIRVKESSVFSRKYYTEVTKLTTLSLFEVEIWCYRGGDEVPKWIVRDSDKFGSLCYVQADLSKLSDSATPKTGTNGQTYWTIVFSIEIHFGLTEFKARMKWNDNGRTRYGPATIVYNERGSRHDEDDSATIPDEELIRESRSEKSRSVPSSRPRSRERAVEGEVRSREMLPSEPARSDNGSSRRSAMKGKERESVPSPPPPVVAGYDNVPPGGYPASSKAPSAYDANGSHPTSRAPSTYERDRSYPYPVSKSPSTHDQNGSHPPSRTPSAYESAYPYSKTPWNEQHGTSPSKPPSTSHQAGYYGASRTPSAYDQNADKRSRMSALGESLTPVFNRTGDKRDSSAPSTSLNTAVEPGQGNLLDTSRGDRRYPSNPSTTLNTAVEPSFASSLMDTIRFKKDASNPPTPVKSHYDSSYGNGDRSREMKSSPTTSNAPYDSSYTDAARDRKTSFSSNNGKQPAESASFTNLLDDARDRKASFSSNSGKNPTEGSFAHLLDGARDRKTSFSNTPSMTHFMDATRDRKSSVSSTAAKSPVDAVSNNALDTSSYQPVAKSTSSIKSSMRLPGPISRTGSSNSTSSHNRRVSWGAAPPPVTRTTSTGSNLPTVEQDAALDEYGDGNQGLYDNSNHSVSFPSGETPVSSWLPAGVSRNPSQDGENKDEDRHNDYGDDSTHVPEVHNLGTSTGAGEAWGEWAAEDNANASGGGAWPDDNADAAPLGTDSWLPPAETQVPHTEEPLAPVTPTAEVAAPAAASKKKNKKKGSTTTAAATATAEAEQNPETHPVAEAATTWGGDTNDTTPAIGSWDNTSNTPASKLDNANDGGLPASTVGSGTGFGWSSASNKAKSTVEDPPLESKENASTPLSGFGSSWGAKHASTASTSWGIGATTTAATSGWGSSNLTQSNDESTTVAALNAVSGLLPSLSFGLGKGNTSDSILLDTFDTSAGDDSKANGADTAGAKLEDATMSASADPPKVADAVATTGDKEEVPAATADDANPATSTKKKKKKKGADTTAATATVTDGAGPSADAETITVAATSETPPAAEAAEPDSAVAKEQPEESVNPPIPASGGAEAEASTEPVAADDAVASSAPAAGGNKKAPVTTKKKKKK